MNMKRLASLVLSVVMLTTTLPLNALAAEEAPLGTEGIVQPDAPAQTPDTDETPEPPETEERAEEVPPEKSDFSAQPPEDAQPAILPNQVLGLSFEDHLDDSTDNITGISIVGDNYEYVPGVMDGKALKLSGGTYINLGTDIALQPQDLTLSFWLNPNEAMSGEQVITWNKGKYDTDGWYLSSEGDDMPLSLSIGPSASNGQPYKVVIDGSRADFFPVGEWTHITVTYDSATKNVAFYRNGVPQTAQINYGISGDATGVLGSDASMEKSIGYNGTVYKGAYLNAALDEYQLFNAAASYGDALSLYAAGGGVIDKTAVAQADLDAITLPKSAVEDLSLPTEGLSGSPITWISDSGAITAAGAVTRPQDGEEDANVILTAATLYDGGERVTREFHITVPAIREELNIRDSGMADVTLLDSWLTAEADKENEYLLALDAETFLYTFYETAGLTPKTESGYAGWERTDGNNFRGHAFGHYMSALAQAYTSSHDADTKAALLTEITEAVNGLKACQDQLGSGYVSAFHESVLNAVDGLGGDNPSNAPAGNVIVPYYNLHKVLAGLLEIYNDLHTAQDAQAREDADNALAVAKGFGTYLYNRLNRLTDQNKMLSVEYGGMNDALYELYRLSGDENHKKAAEYFDETALFWQLRDGQDPLNNKHANTTIPKFIGALKRYTVLSEETNYTKLTDAEKRQLPDYLTAAESFWQTVADSHTYITGGNSRNEHFHSADELCADATGTLGGNPATTCETCNTYNMLKLSRELFKVTGDKKYLDYYENTFINAILAAQDPNTSYMEGTAMYFQPMAPGYNKVYSRPFDEFWCCTGTGMEDFAKLGDSLYYVDGGKVYVSLYFSSEFRYEAQNLLLEQEANIPNSDTVTITVSALDNGAVGDGTTLYLRVPGWVAGDAAVEMNGEAVDATAVHGFIKLENVKAGDVIAYTMPMEVEVHGTQDNPNFVAFKYGPMVLSANLGDYNLSGYAPDGILVRTGVADSSAPTVITVANDTAEAWKADVAKNVVRIGDDAQGRVQFVLKGTDMDAKLVYTPHYMQHGARYGLYMYLENPDSVGSQARILATKQLLREQEISVSSLTNFDANNFEAAKNLQKSEDSGVGVWNNRQYRDAKAGGWFSYDMEVDVTGGVTNYLQCTWYSGDKGRSFEIYLNGDQFKTVTLNDKAGADTFYDELDVIPEAYITAAAETEKKTVTVKFQSTGGLVGGLYGIAVKNTTEYATDPALSALSFNGDSVTLTSEATTYTVKVPEDAASAAMRVSPNVPGGLVYVGTREDGILIDDTLERTVALTGAVTALTLTGVAQDHSTAAEYTILLTKGDAQPRTITVTGGTADKSTAATGETVTVTAPKLHGKTFLSWTVDAGGVTLSDATQAVTTFIVGTENVSVTAQYEKNPNAAMEDLLAAYSFNGTTAAAGTVVADESENGHDATIRGNGATVNSGVLTLPGGGSSSGAAYVELPKGMLDQQETLTISMWLKNETGKGNYAAMYFGGATSGASSYWLFNPCSPQGTFKSVFTNEVNATAPWGTEVGLNTGATDSGWHLYTTVITPDSITGYYDAAKLGTVKKERTVESFGTNLVAYIGRSSYPDPFFKGAVKDVKIYNAALSDGDVAELAEDMSAKVALDKAALTIPNADSIKGNITLPTKGENGSSITWTSNDAAGVITLAAQDGKNPGVVTRSQSGDVTVHLTATLTLNASRDTRDFTLTVKQAPQALDDQYDSGYLFAHFRSKDYDGDKVYQEEIYFGKSTDGLHWNDMNVKSGVTLPVLKSDVGTKGVRDPHIIRSSEGDRYWMIATDLRIEASGTVPSWDDAQTGGSTSLVIWESEDLVNWSEPELVKVNFDTAGCTWAPEAIYNEKTGDYMVYWASPGVPTGMAGERGHRVWYATTRDFRTFSEPQVFIDYNQGAGDFGAGHQTIDTTIVKDGDTYYRFSKNETNGQKYIFIEKSKDLLSGWERVKNMDDIKDVEGATVFQLPDGKWCAMLDQWTYFPVVADSLEDFVAGNYTKLEASEYSFTEGFRHGTVIRLSEAEWDRVTTAYPNPEGDSHVRPQSDEDGLFYSESFDDATVENLTLNGGVKVEDGALVLDGTTNSYASLPTGWFDGLDSATIMFNVKTQLTGGNFFTFSIGQDNQKYLFFRAKGAEFYTAITKASNGGESAANVAGLNVKDQWKSVAITLDGNKLNVYIDGKPAASNPATKATLTELGDSAKIYFGKSLWSNDGFFNGSFDDIRLYDRALSADQVAEATLSSAELLALAKEALTLSGLGSVVTDLTLPAEGLHGAVITWASGNTAVITDAGVVTPGEADAQVILTATLTLGGESVTKDFTANVPAAAGLLDAIAAQLTVPYVLTGDALPVLFQGAAIVWESANADIVTADGTVTLPATGLSDEFALTATLSKNGRSVEKQFHIRATGADSQVVLGYTRDAGDPEIDRSLHLAVGAADNLLTALNDNYGVLFAKADFTSNALRGETKYLSAPCLFRMADGGFGVVALRGGAEGSRAGTEAMSVFVATSPDLISFTEVGLLRLAESGTVNAPICAYDSAAENYRILWKDENGSAHASTTLSFETVIATGSAEDYAAGSPSTAITGAVPGNLIPVTGAEAKALTDRFSHLSNTGVNVEDITRKPGEAITFADLGNAILTYSDGSTAERTVTWDKTAFDKIDFTGEGRYTISGTVDQLGDNFPMLTKKADPNVYYYHGRYYFIATDEDGQDELYLRESDSIPGLKTAAEHKIFTRSYPNGSDMSGCIWAPELHEVDGTLCVFFAAGTNGAWDSVQCRVMALKADGDPLKAEDWNAPQRITRADGSALYSDGITLDMTYFEAGAENTAYVVWSQRQRTPDDGPADLFIATLDKSDPTKLVSAPVRLCTPEYGWDRNTSLVNEGPYVMVHDGKLYLTYSGSNIDDTYCVGLMTADAQADLLDAASWTKIGYPIWTAASIPNQYGPGHNSYTVDALGNYVNIFHAKATPGGERDMGARTVQWGSDGMPILTMTANQEVADENRKVSVTITVKDDGTADEDLELLTALNSVSISNQDDIRGSITLPTGTNGDGVALTWTAEPAGIITTTATPNSGSTPATPAGVVSRPVSDTTVHLTLTAAKNGASKTRVFTLTVKAAEAAATPSAYLYAYFSGDSSRLDDQQIYFAVSKDGIDWQDLNENNPVFSSTLGDLGLRDPYIIRSHEGDRFYLLATDLDIRHAKYAGSWENMATKGSTSLMIWESTDLVNWSEQRMVDVASAIGAGDAWAPEAIYDETTDEYLVYWSSRTDECEPTLRHKIYVSKTRDFQSFTQPELWVANAPEGNIDVSMIKVGDTYYRLIKNDTQNFVTLEKSGSLLSYDGEGKLLTNSYTRVPNSGLEGLKGYYEGATMFQFNGEDKWCTLVDEYGGSNRGYIPLISTDVSADDSFVLMENGAYLMPTGAKHGTVLPISQEEYGALVEKWGVKSPAEETQQAPVLEYNFDETPADATASDASANGNDAVLCGNAKYTADAEKGQVLYLDGSSDTYLSFPEGFFDGRSTMTLSMDVKSLMDSQNFFTFAVGQDTSKYMFLRTRSGDVRNAITTMGSGHELAAKATGSFKNRWMSVSLVMDGNTMSLYIDHKLAAKTEHVRSVSDLGTGLLAYLGKSFYSPDAYFKGCFDNVKVYNRALTAEEIAQDGVVDKNQLQELYDAHKDKVAADYTTDSFPAFEAALVAAKTALDNAAATAQDCTEAYTALQAAAAKLIPASAEHMLAHYVFGSDSTGTDIADSSGRRNNATLRGTGATVSEGVLTLPGGENGSSAAYVELPTGMFDNQNTLTISAWLKNETTADNYAAMYFGATESMPTGYWILNPAVTGSNGAYSRQLKSVVTNAKATDGKPYNTEYGVSPTLPANGVAGPRTDNGWHLYTTVITPTSITAYYDGVKYGPVATTRTVSDFGKNLVAYIGRSSYPDALYKGGVKDVSIYTTALSDYEVLSAFYAGKESEAKDFLKRQSDCVALPGKTTENLTLPTATEGGAKVSWLSRDTAHISSTGAVTRGESNADVVLTATFEVAGYTVARDYTVTVIRSGDAGDVEMQLDAFRLGFTVAYGDVALPAGLENGVSLTWQSSDPTVLAVDGKVNRPAVGLGDSEIILTATAQKGTAQQSKRFTVKVPEAAYGYLMTYTHATNTDRTLALHLAYSKDGTVYTALNNDRPILYAGLSDHKINYPALFRKADGSVGLIATDGWNNGTILLYDSDDLLTFTNERVATIPGVTGSVFHITSAYDALKQAYRISWDDGKGKSYDTWSADFSVFTSPTQSSYLYQVPAGAAPETAINQSVFEVGKGEYDRVLNKYQRVVNTGVNQPDSITVAKGGSVQLPETVTAAYSDGSTKSFGVVWDTAGLDTATAGTYTVTGTVNQPDYNSANGNLLVEQRADPYAVYNDADGYYYFIGSYPVVGNGDSEGYDRLALRRAKTLNGLATAAEIVIWDEKDSALADPYIWAPELHKIGDKWYILFTASRPGWGQWGIRPAMLECVNSSDLMNPASWNVDGESNFHWVEAAKDDTFAFQHFSLDMTHFAADGKNYLVWAEKPTGLSNLYIATIGPATPWKLTSRSVMLTSPVDYAWEWEGGTTINEGPAVLQHNGDVFLCFSAAAVDDTYCVGMLSAKEGADLLDLASWTKNAYPLLTSDDFTGQHGPGHNSFTVDENGNPVIVYHARPDNCDSVTGGSCGFVGGDRNDALRDPCRHARVKSMNFAADGTPILNMTPEEELAAENKTVTVTVTVTADVPPLDKTPIDTAMAAAEAAIASVSVNNAEPSQVADGVKFVSAAARDALNAAIEAAKAAKEAVTSVEEVNAAALALNGALDQFNASIQTGTHVSSYTPPSTTTTTEKNEDGSVTKTVTDKTTGTVTETTTMPNGDKTVVETKKDGTVTETVSCKDGYQSQTVTMPDGSFTAEVTDSCGVKTQTTSGTGGETTAKVTLPKGIDSAKVTIPVKNAAAGTVAVLVKADGTEEIIKTSVVTAQGVRVTVSEDANLKLIDNTKHFADMPQSNWAFESVTFVTARELFNGTSDSTFGGSALMTRGMLMTVLARTDGQDTTGGAAWYEQGMSWAKERGVSDGSAPDAALSREQLVTMLYRYAGSPDVSDMALSEFPDRADVSPYAAAAMTWAVQAGILLGADGKLNPQGLATRAEVSAVLMRFLSI